MKEEKIKIISKADKLPIDCILIKPEGEIKGVIQIAHGMNEHKERYIDFMNFLAENGYASFINDHRGHGKSIKKKEDISLRIRGLYLLFSLIQFLHMAIYTACKEFP